VVEIAQIESPYFHFGPTKKVYIVVLPMSSEEPDSAYIYFKKRKIDSQPIVMLNFNKQTATNQILVDSLQKQNLFFISGETKVGLWK
jgi:cyanophycinase